jgi:hypothetical protein
LCKGAAARSAAEPWFCPAPTQLANQALKPIPKPKIVPRREDQQSKNERKAAPERPVQRLSAERPAPNSLDNVEKQVASIQHRDWQEVDESQIN